MNKICIYILLFSVFINAQNHKNQISLNADDIIPAFFSSNASAYNLGYRRQIKENKNLRIGLKYFQESENEFTLGIKPGIDFAFNNSKKWIFYYGVDLALNYTDNLQSERIRAGIEARRKQGLQIGRKSSRTEGMTEAIKIMIEKGVGVRETMRKLFFCYTSSSTCTACDTIEIAFLQVHHTNSSILRPASFCNKNESLRPRAPT